MDEISGIDAQIYNEKNRNYIYFNPQKIKGRYVEILAFCSDFGCDLHHIFKIEKSDKISTSNFEECSKCGVFSDIDQMVLRDGKYICKECSKVRDENFG